MTGNITALAFAAALWTLPAGAATVEHYDMTLRFEGTTLYEVFMEDLSSNVILDNEDVRPGENAWGIPEPFPAFRIGEAVRFIADVFVPDNARATLAENMDWTNGGRARKCFIGPYDCSKDVTFTLPDLVLGYDDSGLLAGSATPGSRLFYRWVPPAPDYFLIPGPDGLGGTIASHQSNFSVVSIASANIAAVPAPASAALLPVALGALAVFRRRRNIKAKSA